MTKLTKVIKTNQQNQNKQQHKQNSRSVLFSKAILTPNKSGITIPFYSVSFLVHPRVAERMIAVSSSTVEGSSRKMQRI